MTRFWTFQEAVLARALQVQLQDSIYRPVHDHRRESDKYLRIHTRRSIWTDGHELEREAISFYQTLLPLVDEPIYNPPSLLNHESSDVDEFAAIWR